MIKVKQALQYLDIDPQSAAKKRAFYKSNQTYDTTPATIRSLQDANFIPFETPTDALLDIVDDNVYELDFL